MPAAVPYTPPAEVGSIETTLVSDFVPSALRPYAKALVLAVPTIGTAWAVLQHGPIGVISVLQFIVAVLSVLGVYFVPLVPGKWESAAKTGVAAIGAIISAGIAGFGGGGPTAWMGFGSAVLGAVLVEVVDNVPNAVHSVLPAAAEVERIASAVAKVPLPTAEDTPAQG